MPSLFAAIALKFSPIGRFLKAIPRPVWIAFAVILALGGAYWLHRDAVSDAYRAGYSQGKADEGARIAKRAGELAAETNALAAKIRSKNREKIRRIDAAADTLRLSGPGKASCPGAATPVAGRSAPQQPGNAAVDQVPDRARNDIIALPFADTIAFAEQHDRCLADLSSYRDWETQIREAWAKK